MEKNLIITKRGTILPKQDLTTIRVYSPKILRGILLTKLDQFENEYFQDKAIKDLNFCQKE